MTFPIEISLDRGFSTSTSQKILSLANIYPAKYLVFLGSRMLGIQRKRFPLETVI